MMWRLAIIIHILLMTVLMGALVIIITSVPSLYDQGMKLIPIAAATGFLASIPLSVLVAKSILAQTKAH